MNSNIIQLRTNSASSPTKTAQDPFDALTRTVRAIIEKRRLVAARRSTRRQLQDLPAVVRRDIGITDERDHQDY